MKAEQLLHYRIALTLLKGVGPIVAQKLYDTFGEAEELFNAPSQILQSIPRIGKSLSDPKARYDALVRAEQEVEFITKNRIKTYFFRDENYPYRLKECPDAPSMLYGIGNFNPNAPKIISVIGTRNATEFGKESCNLFIEELSHACPDSIVISGLAYGIDITAHKAALQHNISTVGVVAHGLDRIYPQQHTPIAKQMVERGGIMTEFLSQTNPDAPNFVQRNRIVAGMSDATVVIESADKGGALITAYLATEYSREVFAFPGRPIDTQSRGCNKLISEQKAALIQNCSDFLRQMNWETSSITTREKIHFPDLSSDEETIVKLLSHTETTTLSDLTLQSELSVQKILPILIHLEFNGIIKTLPGNSYRLTLPRA